MATDRHPERRKTRPGQAMVSVLSFGSAIAVFNFSWKFRDDVGKIVESQAHLFKPTSDEIRTVCNEVVEVERDRAKEREQELKNAIDFLMRYYERRVR